LIGFGGGAWVFGPKKNMMYKGHFR